MWHNECKCKYRADKLICDNLFAQTNSRAKDYCFQFMQNGFT